MTRSTGLRYLWLVVVGGMAWLVLGLQYALMLEAGDGSVPDITVRFFGFFTILSNLWVALVCSFALAERFRADGRSQGIGRWFRSPRAMGAAALYIGITHIVYVAILHALWHPTGAQWWADIGLHYAVPLLYIAGWLLFAPRPGLRWGDALRWLIFPLVFVIWTLSHGAAVHEYPYPFLDVDTLGMASVSVNILALGAGFLLLGSALIASDRAIGRFGRTQVPDHGS
jgi:hypothetical protein